MGDFFKDRAAFVLRVRGVISQGIGAFSRRLFEVPLQFLKGLYLLPDGRKPLMNQVPDVGTRFDPLVLNEEKLSDLSKREPKLLRLSDKEKVLNVPLTIEPIAAFASGRFSKEPLFLVEADGVNGKSRLFRSFTNLNTSRHV